MWGFGFILRRFLTVSSNLSPFDMTKIQSGFHGAELKVERAKRHVDEVHSLINRLNEKDLERFAIHQDNHGQPICVFDGFEDDAMDISIAAGDAIHNLRCSLDHIWTALERAATGKLTTRGYFPFHETWANLRDAIAKSAVKAAFPQIEALVLNEAKPCRETGGDILLWSISKLDNLDKHNIIIPVFAPSFIRALTYQMPNGSISSKSCCVFDSSTALAFAGPQKPEILQADITVSPLFPDGLIVVGGKEVLPTLVYMTKATEKVVNLFREVIVR